MTGSMNSQPDPAAEIEEDRSARVQLSAAAAPRQPVPVAFKVAGKQGKL